MTAAVLEEMSEGQVLAFAGACADAAWQAEVDLLHAAYQWAILHSEHRLDPGQAGLPGRQRARQLGGPGTPRVAEFAAAELGARIGRTTQAAARLIGDALDLAHRLPQLWGRVRAGEVRASYARHVCDRTRDLSRQEAAFVDAGVVESADGRLPWTRFEALVDAKVAQADPATMREREKRHAKARFAKKTQNEAHGMASFLIRADVATINAIEAAVTAIAHALAPAMPDATDDERRVLAVLFTMTGHRPSASDQPSDIYDDSGGPAAAPGGRAGSSGGRAGTSGGRAGTSGGRACRDPRTEAGPAPEPPDVEPSDLELPDLADVLPTVNLYVHMYRGHDTESVLRLEGHGPVTDAWLRTVLGPQARFKVQPVLDLAQQAPVEAYEIPERHRQAVHLMTPADTFTYGSCTDRTMQIDHTVPYREGGATGVGNYGPMSITHHRFKTHAPGWEVRQPFPGIYIWRDPHGAHYLVDHTGTRRIHDAA